MYYYCKVKPSININIFNFKTFNTIILGFVGAKPAEGAWLLIGRLSTLYYFLHLLVLIPLVGRFEKTKPLPDSISSSVISVSTKDEEPANA